MYIRNLPYIIRRLYCYAIYIQVIDVQCRPITQMKLQTAYDLQIASFNTDY